MTNPTPSPDEKTEAKVCPFCDKEPTMIKAFDKPVAVCQSEGCALAGFWVALKQWNRRTPAQADDVDKVLAEQQGEIERLGSELAKEKRLRQELRHIANVGGAEISNLCDVFIDEKNRYKAQCERLQADLEAAEKEKARIKRESHNCYEDCVSKLDANQRIATEQDRVMELVCIPMIEQKEAEFAQSLTHARAEAKALAYEECRQTVAQVFDDYRHLIQREFNEKYGDNLSGENFLGDAVDFAIRKIEAEGGSQ